MSQTIDQTGRPAGHPGYCSCADCAVWFQRREKRIAEAGPPAQQPTPWQAPVAPPPGSATDYLRRIHWWVRLAGIIWIVIPALFAAVMMAILIIGMATGQNQGF